MSFPNGPYDPFDRNDKFDKAFDAQFNRVNKMLEKPGRTMLKMGAISILITAVTTLIVVGIVIGALMLVL